MPFPLDMPFADSVLGAMITPAVLITACGPLALATTNRLGRVVDRVRAIGAEAEGMRPDDGTPFDEIEDKREQLNDQLVRLVKRICMLQNGLTAIYAALGLLVGSSLSIGVKSATDILPEGIPVFFGLSGASRCWWRACTLSGKRGWRSTRPCWRWLTSGGSCPGRLASHRRREL